MSSLTEITKSVSELIDNYARVIEQRDKLLEACENILSSTCGDIGDDGYEGCIRIDAASLDLIRSAISFVS